MRKLDYKLIASAETQMWRGYYERDQGKVRRSLEIYFREMFNLENSITIQEIATAFAIAYMKFGNTPIDSPQQEYDKAVLPALSDAYQALKNAINASWEPVAVAKADIDWMVSRRHIETLEPEIVAKKMATLFHLLYGNKDNNHIIRAAYLRAVAARYRDQCQIMWGGADQHDWDVVEGMLEKTYFLIAKGEANNILGLQ
jgi:hypothetical protein